MALKDFFKKKSKKKIDPVEARKKAEKVLGGEMPEITDDMIDKMLKGDMPGMPKLGPMQKMALKGIKKMSPEKRKQVFAEAFGKMNAEGGEDKEEMLKQIEEMRAAGQLNSKQYKIAKKRLGIK
jgi:predicted molibdopterin-dependent oxidoreductase YjgC